MAATHTIGFFVHQTENRTQQALVRVSLWLMDLKSVTVAVSPA
jgi:hypothetical protein